MNAPNDVPYPPADAGEVMSPEAVARMERQLLDAFSRHHQQAGWMRRHTISWVGIAAALSILASAGATWRSLHVDASTFAGCDRGASRASAGGHEHRVGPQRTGVG